MKLQTIKISDTDRKLLSDFCGEDVGNEIDWNVVMQLVEKIGEIKLRGGKYSEFAEFQISTNDGTGWIFWRKNSPGDQNQPQAYLSNGTLLDKTYYAIVEFIKWHKENKV